MILLMGFKAYDDFATEYQVSGEDVMRVAQCIRHPAPVTRTNTVCYVTFYHEGLTSENCNENIQAPGADSQLEFSG